MKKPLSLYQGQISFLQKKRAELDEDFAQVLAEGLHDGYKIYDLLTGNSKDDSNLEFDL